LVELGQALLRIDDVRLGANMQESQARMNGLQAAAIRLKAESIGSSPVFSAELIRRNAQLIKSEQETFIARKRSLDTSIAVLQQNLKVAQDEMKITEPLAARGLVSEIEVLRILRTVSESRGKIIELQTKFRSDAASELTRIEGELGSQGATLLGRKDAFQRTVLRSPKRGVVKNMRVNTLGAVVQSGQDIMEIVPVGEELLVEAFIKPADIAFVHVGQRAMVKFSAYDFGKFGGIDGTLMHVSPDTLKDERQQKPGNPVALEEGHYRVIVKLEKGDIVYQGKSMPIMAGMVNTIDIRTGHKTVLEYILRPLQRVSEALTEK
jgi:adhesin transport system membrane fusion protein